MFPRNLHRHLLVSTLLGLLCLHLTEAYSNGAPDSAEICEKLSPQHGADPQTSPSPYNVQINANTVNGGQSLSITIEAPPTEPSYFKGFFFTVKKAGDAKSAVGKFNIISNQSQSLNCFGQKGSAVTHKGGAPKQSVALEWIAPNEDLSGLEVVYTIVQDGEIIWQDIKHPNKLTIKRDVNYKEVVPVAAKLNGETLKKLREYYALCEDGAHGCMGIPNGCIQSFLSEKESDSPPTCTAMVSWEAAGDRNVYRLTGTPSSSPGYVAVGFSEDNKMGGDSVAGCYQNSEGTVVAGRFQNAPGDKYNAAVTETLLGIKPATTSASEGHLFCEFDQTDHTLNGIIDIQLREKEYHILLAKGGDASPSSLQFHGTSSSDIGASGQKVDITFVGILGADLASVVLYKLHGAFMIVAWLVCASTGMFTARYYKMTHTDFMPFNKAFWFALHVFCMFSTVILTVCGAIFIFIKKGGWFPKDGKYWHPILGVILFGLAAFQVLIAFLRPHPGTKFRPLFNWVHWLVGNSAHIVGIACIFLANDLPAASLDRQEYLFTTLGAVLFHIVMHLVLSFHTLWADKQLGSSTKRAVTPAPMKPHSQQTEAPGTGFRSFMMALYAVGLLGCAVALIIFICVPPESSNS